MNNRRIIFITIFISKILTSEDTFSLYFLFMPGTAFPLRILIPYAIVCLSMLAPGLLIGECYASYRGYHFLYPVRTVNHHFQLALAVFALAISVRILALYLNSSQKYTP